MRKALNHAIRLLVLAALAMSLWGCGGGGIDGGGDANWDQFDWEEADWE